MTTSTGGWVFLPGQGKALRSRIEARLDHPTLPVVNLSIVVEGGRPTIESLTLDRTSPQRGLTTADLRSVPLRALLAHVVASTAMPARFENGRLVIQMIADPTDEDVAGGSGGGPGSAPSPTRHTVDSAFLARAVELYREALAAGNPRPRVSVGATLGLSSARVGTLLHRARRTGLLGAAETGRAGELNSKAKEEQP